MSCSNVEQNDIGIAKIEAFLDKIEDLDEEVLDHYQEKFPQVIAEWFKDVPEEKHGSAEFFLNQSRKESFEDSSHCIVKTGTETTDGVEKCYYKGGLDSCGRPTGEGTLVYNNLDSFTGMFDHSIRNRTGVRSFSGGEVSRIAGTWRDGLLEGRARTDFTTGGYLEGFYSFGVLHGVARQFGIGCYLQEMSFYHRGLRVGWVYEGLLGGGYLVGRVDSGGRLTGPDISYIYPDFRTAIRGQYEASHLVSGTEARVVSSRTELGEMVVPEFSPAVSEVTFSRDLPTRLEISQSPLTRDPWEETQVAVRKSGLEQAGEGLFAKEDLPAKTLVALFAGVRLKSSRVESRDRPRSDYRIRLNADLDLDIPDHSLSTSVYCATLGHKANHSFLPNATFDIIDHPRFGLIRAIASMVDISAGSEITVNYNLGLSQGPPWYRMLWVRHVRENKGWGQKEIERYIERNYDMTMKRIQLPDDDCLRVPTPVGALKLDLEEEEVEESVNVHN